jgi:alpha-glucosidase/alpha-D-xyloside xylohydrolase
LIDRVYPEPVIRLRSVDEPVEQQVGSLIVRISAEPLTVRVSNAEGRLLQELVFDSGMGNVSFNVGNAPVLGLGEGGQQPGRGRGYQGPQFDRRGRLDNMRPGWGSGTLGSRNPVALLVGTEGWGLWVASPWVQVDLRDEETGHFIPTDEVDPTAGVAAEFQPATPRRDEADVEQEDVIPSAARQAFDVFVFDATNPQDMMQDLRGLNGVPAMPPNPDIMRRPASTEPRPDPPWSLP